MVKRTSKRSRVQVSEKEALEINLNIVKFRETSLVIRTAMKYGAILIAIYWATNLCGSAIKELAGKETITDIKVDFLSKLFPAMFGVGGVGFGIKEYTHRKKETKRYSENYNEVKKGIDNNSKSSKLDEYGRTQRREAE